MENIQNQQNNNTDNNIQPLVSLVNLISDNLNNPNPNNNYLNQNYTEKKDDNSNIISIDEKKEKEKEKDDILLEIDQIIGKETIENTFKSTQEDNSSNLNKSENVMEIGENHFLKSDNNVNNNNYSSTYNISKETLDEAIITTINRDLYSIYIKLIFVINPFISDEVKKYHIKQWDLWGPLIFNVLLASTLAINSDNRGQTIILIFLIFWLGSFLVFLNGHLLGVKTSIFQIFCLLGYCLFPLNISAFIFSFTRPPDILKFIVIGLTCFWSLFSASSYLGNLTIPEQRYLVLYPCILLYLYISWFIFSIKH
jgi:hypothetical protein